MQSFEFYDFPLRFSGSVSFVINKSSVQRLCIIIICTLQRSLASFLFHRFIVYKLPKIEESARRYVTMGLGYVYMDSETKQFTLANKSIRTNVTAVVHALQQIYAANGIGYIMYNDEDPEG